MKNLFVKGFTAAILAISVLGCNKNEAGKGEKEEGIYYNERTDKNGSSDTAAATHQNAQESGQNIGNSSDSTTVDGSNKSVSNN